MIYFDSPRLMSNHHMDRFLSRVACVLVCLQLITLVRAVITKSFAVWAEVFLALWLLGPIGGCAVSGWGHVFFVIVLLAAGGATRAFIRSSMVSMLVLLVGAIVSICLLCCPCSNAKKHGLSLSFLLCGRCLLCLKQCFLEARLLGCCCRVLIPFVPFFGEVCLKVCPGLVGGSFILPRDHLVLCKHFALPHFWRQLPSSSLHCLLQCRGGPKRFGSGQGT